ncbi:MAG: type II toxin-antitoxin system HigB family toxin [Anaerolineaceae bacterium]|nr:type II toxin-antitoxin system HigB family toxin [Anaerolineaceae bacterium]
MEISLFVNNVPENIYRFITEIVIKIMKIIVRMILTHFVNEF